MSEKVQDSKENRSSAQFSQDPCSSADQALIRQLVGNQQVLGNIRGFVCTCT